MSVEGGVDMSEFFFWLGGIGGVCIRWQLGQFISNEAVWLITPLRFPRYFYQVILYQTYVEIPNIRHISALALKLQPLDFFIDFSNSTE